MKRVTFDANSYGFESDSPRVQKDTNSHGRGEADTVALKLLERPSFSFRLQIILGFLLFFMIFMVIIIGSLAAINLIQKKLHFVQVCERYLFEIEQARRWEKNYFLYGTNLDDAQQSINAAENILSKNLQNLRMILSPRETAMMLKGLDEYKNLLKDLAKIESATEKNAIETALRKRGKEMVELGAFLVSKERESINTTMKLIHRIPIYALIVLLLLMIYVAHFITRRFMKPLNRLIDITDGIAKGDFSPIGPMRKYRDEFTTVELAINRMLEQLDAHQTAMVESHKLRAIGTLTAGVAHELNNPLNNIMLTAHSLLEDHKELPESDLVEMLNDLVGEADRSQSIVRNLLDFTRKSESVTKAFDLGVLVNETTKLALNQAKVSGAKIDVKVKPNLPQIRGDRQQLKQVFLNLILNALDAVGKQGRIKIGVERHPRPGFLAVHVQDNGCGIPPYILPHIFDPFFTTKAPRKGTGLGLSVCQGIVTKHGGWMNISTEQGKYTRVTVALPSTNIPADFKRIKATRGMSLAEDVYCWSRKTNKG